MANGDPAAVQACLQQYGGLVWSLARRYLGNAAETEDAVQEVFIELWKSAGRFDGSKSSEQSFVAMVARRRVIDRLRRRGRRLDLDTIDDEGPEPPSDEHISIERGAEARLAAESFAELPPERRRVLELSVYKGLTHQEISNTLEMPLGTVKSHITRGLAYVRQRLETEQSTGGEA
ncbi:MAG: sigma-70 family RNA polymerase sigma factor [Acidobacteria bacterium]|nr:sigma-70 family RNA polymerase sigma factor [Acidobacteriota bacterium]